VKTQFEQWEKDISSLGLIKIPRYAFMYGDEGYQLHIFCDASKDAFAAVVFVRTEGPERVSVQLLMAKSRVAPMKASTIPRLELLGCLIGARLCRAVTEGLVKEVPTKWRADGGGDQGCRTSYLQARPTLSLS
jgi:hypothetical protein